MNHDDARADDDAAAADDDDDNDGDGGVVVGGRRWKDKDFKYAPGRSRQMPGYIGSYAMDNLSMSLHCIYHTTSAKVALRIRNKQQT